MRLKPAERTMLLERAGDITYYLMKQQGLHTNPDPSAVQAVANLAPAVNDILHQENPTLSTGVHVRFGKVSRRDDLPYLWHFSFDLIERGREIARLDEDIDATDVA